MTIWRPRALFGVSAAADSRRDSCRSRNDARPRGRALASASPKTGWRSPRPADAAPSAASPAPTPSPEPAGGLDGSPVAAPLPAQIERRSAAPTGASRPQPRRPPRPRRRRPRPPRRRACAAASMPRFSPAARRLPQGRRRRRSRRSRQGRATPTSALALEWAALRRRPAPDLRGARRLRRRPSDLAGRRDGCATARKRISPIHPIAAETVAAYFAAAPPQSSAGKIALARALGGVGPRRRGDRDRPRAVARRRFRRLDRSRDPARIRRRAARRPTTSIAPTGCSMPRARAGAAARRRSPAPTRWRSPQARIAAARGPLSPALVKAVPQALKSDPGLLFARVQDARRAGRAYEAATLLGLAPTDRAALIDPDKWWSERRMVARELLDLDEPRLAFELCAEAAPPDAAAARSTRDFHAGWIALRFLGDAPARRRALRARGRGGRDAALDRPRRLLARPRRRGDGRRRRRAGFLRERREPADRLLRPARRRAARREAARPARAERGRGRATSATKRCARSSALRRRARRPRRRARLRGGPDLERRGADSRRWPRSWSATPTRRPQVAVRQDRDPARLRLRRDGLPGLRRAGLPAARPVRPISPSVYAVARQESEFVWRARLRRGRQGAHADPALDRGLDRAAGRRRLRLRAAARRSRPSTPSSARPFSGR